MAWGLAEFDAEQRGKKEGYSEGVSDGEYQKAIETAKICFFTETLLKK